MKAIVGCRDRKLLVKSITCDILHDTFAQYDRPILPESVLDFGYGVRVAHKLEHFLFIVLALTEARYRISSAAAPFIPKRPVTSTWTETISIARSFASR